MHAAISKQNCVIKWNEKIQSYYDVGISMFYFLNRNDSPALPSEASIPSLFSSVINDFIKIGIVLAESVTSLSHSHLLQLYIPRQKSHAIYKATLKKMKSEIA